MIKITNHHCNLLPSNWSKSPEIQLNSRFDVSNLEFHGWAWKNTGDQVNFETFPMTQCNGQQAIFWSALTSDLVLRGLLWPDDDRLSHDLPHPAPSPSGSSGAAWWLHLETVSAVINWCNGCWSNSTLTERQLTFGHISVLSLPDRVHQDRCQVCKVAMLSFFVHMKS